MQLPIHYQVTVVNSFKHMSSPSIHSRSHPSVHSLTELCKRHALIHPINNPSTYTTVQASIHSSKYNSNVQPPSIPNVVKQHTQAIHALNHPPTNSRDHQTFRKINISESPRRSYASLRLASSQHNQNDIYLLMCVRC